MTAATATSTIITGTVAVPLSKLRAWEGNVRRTNSDAGIGELASSIAAHGLLQALVVRRDRKGLYEVVAGRRRFLALKSLVREGKINDDHDIPCHVIAGDANATEISLAENAVRMQMHPADEFEAFAALIGDGMRAADIAARFGVTETVVQQRLRLARVSPAILEAYRRGDLALAHVMAFAVTDDHAAQERVRGELSDWQLEDPDNIRAALTEDEVSARDRRVKFVTLKAYEKAGGAVRRDLFAQGDDGVFIEDTVLLESLVAKKLDRVANRLRNEGWKWVEVRPSFDYSEWSKCVRKWPEPPPLPAALQTELDALVAEQEALTGAAGGGDHGDDSDDNDDVDNNDDDDDADHDHDHDDQNPRLNEIARRIDEIEDREKIWTPETLAVAGVVVTLDYQGKADIHAGYVKPEDAPTRPRPLKTVTHTAEDGTVTTVEVADRALPASLIESLTAHRSAAMAARLGESPDAALAAVVHALAMQLIVGGTSREGALTIMARESRYSGLEESAVFGALQHSTDHWRELLPRGSAELWNWCLAQGRETLLALLAHCAALTVDAVQRKHDAPDADRLQHGLRLAQALRLDMTQWFRATADNYFGGITRDGILAALREMKGAVAPAWEKAKKTDLAVIAEREAASCGWLPELLRE